MTHLVFILIYSRLFFFFFLLMFWFAKLQVVCLTMCAAWRTDGLFSSSRWHAKTKFYHSNFGLRYFIRNGCFNSYFTTHQLHCVSFHIGYDFTTNLVSHAAAVPHTSSSQTAVLYKSVLGESSPPKIFTLVREGDSPKCSERSPGITSQIASGTLRAALHSAFCVPACVPQAPDGCCGSGSGESAVKSAVGGRIHMY